MLIAIRERSKGWLAWLVVGAIALAFTATGIYSYFSAPPSTEVAEVAGVPITRDAVEREYQQQRRQLAQMFGGELDPQLFDERALRREALQSLIDQALLRQYVDAQGFQVSDAALADYIRSQPFFHVGGQFSSDQYQTVLRSEGLTPQGYEARLRVEQALAQAQQGIYESAFVTDKELQRLLDLQRQERQLAYLSVPIDAFKADIEVTEEDVRAYYEQNQSLFQRPEQVRLAYLELAPEALAESEQISDEELRRYYEEIKQSRYSSGGERQVRHILLTVPAGASAEETEQVRARLEHLREEILSGAASFDEIAREYSEEPGAAENGGDLGVVSRGDMVPEFEQVAFSLQQGELSEPVLTKYGWHLIEVTDITPEQVRSFAEVKDELRQEMVQRQVSREVSQRANTLANLAYEHPDELESAASSLGLEVQQTGWVSRQGAEEGLTAHPEVMEAAFSTDVLQNRRNSDLLELGPNHYAVVRVLEHQQAETKPLAEVQSEARVQLEQQRMADLAQELGAELKQAVAAGESLQELAQNEKVQLEQPGFVSRDAQDVPAAILQQAFQLPKPADGSVSVGSTRLRDGGYAVVVVSDVRTQGADEEQAQQQAEQMERQLKNFEGERALRGLMAILRAEGNVKIYEGRL